MEKSTTGSRRSRSMAAENFVKYIIQIRYLGIFRMSNPTPGPTFGSKMAGFNVICIDIELNFNRY